MAIVKPHKFDFISGAVVRVDVWSRCAVIGCGDVGISERLEHIIYNTVIAK